MSAQAATKVEAKVYQLYIVEYQCALRLMSQNRGMEDITVSAKSTMNKAAQTVLSQIYLLPCSTFNGVLSMLREMLRILRPSRDQPTSVMMVHTVKKPLLRKPDL